MMQNSLINAAIASVFGYRNMVVENWWENTSSEDHFPMLVGEYKGNPSCLVPNYRRENYGSIMGGLVNLRRVSVSFNCPFDGMFEVTITGPYSSRETTFSSCDRWQALVGCAIKWDFGYFNTGLLLNNSAYEVWDVRKLKIGDPVEEYLKMLGKSDWYEK